MYFFYFANLDLRKAAAQFIEGKKKTLSGKSFLAGKDQEQSRPVHGLYGLFHDDLD